MSASPSHHNRSVKSIFINSTCICRSHRCAHISSAATPVAYSRYLVMPNQTPKDKQQSPGRNQDQGNQNTQQNRGKDDQQGHKQDTQQKSRKDRDQM